MNIAQTVIDATLFLKEAKGVTDFALVGSCLIVDKPKDVDVLVLVNSEWQLAQFASLMDACCQEGEYVVDAGEAQWGAYRKGDANFIVTTDSLFFMRMRRASEVCLALKLTSKKDRVLVHRIVRDGKTAEEALLSVAGFLE